MKPSIIFFNGRFGFKQNCKDTEHLFDEIRDLVKTYGIESIKVEIVTDKEYSEEEQCTR